MDPIYKILESLNAVQHSVVEADEDHESASPDEENMALVQARFIQYAGKEIEEHILEGGKFPEWYQNKLYAVYDQLQGLHAWAEGTQAGHEDEMWQEIEDTADSLLK